MVHIRKVYLTASPHAALLPSPAEMAKFDAATIEGGVSAVDLMEKAGAAVAGLIYELYGAKFGPDHPVTVLCGVGNNGGDGLVAARYLRAHGCHVAVVMTAAAKYSPELTAEVTKYVTLGEEFFMFAEDVRGLDQPGRQLDLKTLRELLRASWMVIDALLGTGQKDAPRGAVKSVVECLNLVRSEKGSALKCVAIDVPTGVDPGSGRVFEPHVQADLTVSIELVKRGLLQYPGREACGEIRVVSADISCSEGAEFSLITRNNAMVKLPPRRLEAHKGDFGRVLVIGGSPGMPGAPAMAALAALRTGAGLVSKVKFGGGLAEASIPELLHEVVPEEFERAAVPRLLQIMRGMSCTVIGPGMGTAAQTKDALAVLFKAIQEENLTVLIDADALNILAELLKEGENIKLSQAILTPHAGEMARLLGADSPAAIQADRYKAARELSHLTDAVVVLKGASSVIYKGKQGFVNLTGNPFMATAGSGDVLSGMIAGFVAQGKSLIEAAACGVFYHGLAGDQAHQKSRGPIIAGDIIAAIPGALAIGML